MGYTHYFDSSNVALIDSKAIALINKIVAEHKDILCLEFDLPDTAPCVNEEYVQFNGKEDDGHETFVFNVNKEQNGWSGEEDAFCKTSEKPYDFAVCKVLLVLKHFHDINLSSDGKIDGSCKDESWKEAQEWMKVNIKDYEMLDTNSSILLTN